jgi:hypothetical protein
MQSRDNVADGRRAGIGDRKSPRQPLVSNCLGMPDAGTFFAFLPNAPPCPSQQLEGQCTGGCAATGG